MHGSMGHNRGVNKKKSSMPKAVTRGPIARLANFYSKTAQLRASEKKKVFIFEKPSDNNRAQHPYKPLLSGGTPEECRFRGVMQGLPTTLQWSHFGPNELYEPAKPLSITRRPMGTSYGGAPTHGISSGIPTTVNANPSREGCKENDQLRPF